MYHVKINNRGMNFKNLGKTYIDIGGGFVAGVERFHVVASNNQGVKWVYVFT